jgi:hypothetical protein
MLDQGTNSKFIEHAPCRECGSPDNVAVYEDGHGYCFGCEHHYKDYHGKGNGAVRRPINKKTHNNLKHTSGGYYEVPTSLDFTDNNGRREIEKRKKGYDTHYVYTDKSGNTQFVVERQYKDETNKEKRFFQHSKWKDKINNYERWMSRGMPEPRCIYNLRDISQTRTSANIVVVEGEKAAEAYKRKRLDCVTTWAGGAKAVLKNDWSILNAFTRITLFPDNDDEGHVAMHKLAMHLHQEIGIDLDRIHFVTLPDEFPEKWDLADPVPKNSNTDAHTLQFEALPYTEVTPNYKDVWEKFSEKKLQEVDRSKAERLLELSENIFYIAELDEMLDLNKDVLTPLRSFDNQYGYLKVERKKPSTWLLEQEPEVFKRANSYEYQPQRPRGLNDVAGVPIVNRYRGPTIKPKQGDMTIWKDTLIDVFDDENRANNMEQYFAYCYQNQGTKAMWAPLWISPKKGIGKGWITELLHRIYGKNNFRPNLKYKSVTSNFNSWIIGTQFAVINEVFLSKNYNKKQELSEEIKDLITDPYIHIEEKFRRSFDYPNTCNFILISNHEDCMNIADDERRYYVLKLTDKVRLRDYWKPRWDWASNDGARFLMHHLSTLKIDDPDLYKERAPITEDMRELAKLSEHPIYKWLDLHREAETGPFKRSGSTEFRVFNFMVVAQDLHRTCTAFKQDGALDVVIAWCKSRCTSWDHSSFVPTKQMLTKDGTRPRVYLLPPAEPETAKDHWVEKLRACTASQLGQIYEQKGSYRPIEVDEKTKEKKRFKL